MIQYNPFTGNLDLTGTSNNGAWGYHLPEGRSVHIEEGQFWLMAEPLVIDGSLLLDGKLLEIG